MSYAAVRRRTLAAMLAVTVALVTGCAAGTSAESTRPTATALRTATPTAIPAVLYQADWSHGAGGWTLSAHWSVQDQMLVNDGGGLDPIPVPYTISTPDYEIDLVAKAAAITTPLNCAELYGVDALDSSGSQLYYAQIYCFGTSPSHHPGASLLRVTAQNSDLLATADFFPNDDWKTYRILVHNKGIRFFPNSSAPNGGLNAPVALSPATFNLLDQHMPLVIRKFAILKLDPLGT